MTKKNKFILKEIRPEVLVSMIILILVHSIILRLNKNIKKFILCKNYLNKDLKFHKSVVLKIKVKFHNLLTQEAILLNLCLILIICLKCNNNNSIQMQLLLIIKYLICNHQTLTIQIIVQDIKQ